MTKRARPTASSRTLPNGRNKHEPFVMMPRYVVRSPAYRSLSLIIESLVRRHWDGAHRAADIHADTTPMRERRKPHLVVVLRVSEGTVKCIIGRDSAVAKSERFVEIISPGAVLIDPVEGLVGSRVVDCIEAGVQQFDRHAAEPVKEWIGAFHFHWVVVVRLSDEVN